MKRNTLSMPFMLMMLAAATALAGCLPHDLIVWSPNGRTAVVLGSQQTYLCNAEGKLQATNVGPISAAAWSPDSKSVVAAVRKSTNSWDEFSSILSEQDRAQTVQSAKKLQAIIIAQGGRMSDQQFGEAVKDAFGERSDLVAPALLYLRQIKSPELAQALGPKKTEDLMEKFETSYAVLQVLNCSDTTLSPGTVIGTWPREVTTLRLSPDGRFVAFVTPPPGSGDRQLFVVAVQAKAEPRLAAEASSVYPDWSVDGRQILFARPSIAEKEHANETMRLGSIARRIVVDPEGALLDKFSDAEDLAGLLYMETTKVRCLKDGQIVFSSAEMTLPTTTDNMPKNMSLFTIDPAHPKTVCPLISGAAQEQLADYATDLFQVSPDGLKISVPSQKGKVAIFTPSTGKVDVIQTAEGKDLVTVPTWRTADDLCLALPQGAPGGTPDRAEIALYSNGTTHVISRDWPQDVAKQVNLVPESQPETATQP